MSVGLLWHRIVQRDGEWCRVAWTCPECQHPLLHHFTTLGGCADCTCTLNYERAERAAHEAVKTLVGA